MATVIVSGHYNRGLEVVHVTSWLLRQTAFISRLAVGMACCLLVFTPMALALESTVTVQSPKALISTLSSAEEVGARMAKADPQTIRGVTVKLKNFIEDVVLSSGSTATLHPAAIAKVISDGISQGRSKREIASLLVELQKNNKL